MTTTTPLSDPAPGATALDRSLRRVAGGPARIAAVAAATGGLVVVATARLVADVVDAIVFAGAGATAIAPSLALLAVLALVRAGAGIVCERAAFEAAARVRRHLSSRLLDHVARLGPVRLAEESLGEIAATATEAVDAVAPAWRDWRPAHVRAAVVPVAVLIAVAPRDPLAAVIFVVALPLLVWFSILAGKGAEEASGRQWATLARLGGHLLDQIRGLGERRLAGTSEAAIAAVKASAERYGRETMAVLRIAFLSALVLEFVATGAIAGVAVAVGFRLMWGTIDFATGFFVLLLAPEFFAPLREIGVRRHGRIEATAALETIAAVLDRPAPEARATARGTGETGTGGTGASGSGTTGTAEASGARPPAIRFEGVRVVHADGRVALDGLDLDVAGGEHVAIVGPSGAGKTTVLALLCRFLEPSEGRILIDGVPLATIEPEAWRRVLALVPQSPPFFEGTVADNVALGRITADGDRDAAVRRALAAARADGFVDRLPQGAATPLGEGAHDLSGGEAQRLALARAFYAPAPLVLLDEPTAHLDAATQAEVGGAIAALRHGRTAITVAHRLETVADADRIVVLDHGRVVASGTPAMLRPHAGDAAPSTPMDTPPPLDTAREAGDA